MHTNNTASTRDLRDSVLEKEPKCMLEGQTLLDGNNFAALVQE